MTKTEKNILAKINGSKLSTTEFTKREMKTVWELVSRGILKSEEGNTETVPYTKTRNFGRNTTHYTMTCSPVYISIA